MSEIDLLKLLEGDDTDDNEDDKTSDEKIEELTEMVSELKTQNAGLLKAKQEEKRKRQGNQEKLDQIETKLNEIVESKKTPTKIVESLNDKGLTVEFTPDGVPFVPKDKLNEIVEPAKGEIEDLKKQLNTAIASNKAAMKADKFVRDVLSEDERYPAVYSRYKGALDWVENKVIDFQNSNNVKGYLTSSQAMDLVFKPNPELKEEFDKEFEGMKLISVLIAQDSEEFFRDMLDSNLPTDNTNDDDRFKKALQKPSGLGDVAKNNKGTELSVLDKLHDLSTDDVFGLSDKQVDGLLAALREEETGG